MKVSKMLYFGAVHCGQCRTLKPKFIAECERLGLKEGIHYEFVDAEEDEERAVKYNIRNLPTIVFLDDRGNEADRSYGASAWEEISNLF